jgi:hypothetical protein
MLFVDIKVSIKNALINIAMILFNMIDILIFYSVYVTVVNKQKSHKQVNRLTIGT